MPPITPEATGMVCSQPDCGLDVALIGDMWVHPHIDNGWFRNCDGGRSPNHAVPPLVEVTERRHTDGSTSWHVFYELGEPGWYAVWFSAAAGRYMAWRTFLDVTDPNRAGVPTLTEYGAVGRYPTDPEPLLQSMPPVVAYWLRDAILPF